MYDYKEQPTPQDLFDLEVHRYQYQSFLFRIGQNTISKEDLASLWLYAKQYRIHPNFKSFDFEDNTQKSAILIALCEFIDDKVKEYEQKVEGKMTDEQRMLVADMRGNMDYYTYRSAACESIRKAFQ